MIVAPPTPPAPPAVSIVHATPAPAPQELPPYTYVGHTYGGAPHAVFTLNSANVSGGSHAGLWMGVGQFKTDWLQGGVEQSDGDTQPYAYIEAGANGQQTHFERFPVAYGEPVHVTLVPHGPDHVSVVVNGHSYGAMRANLETLQSMLELYNTATALGTINGHIVSGHP